MPSPFDLPALLIVAAVTVLLIYGIRESATTNTTIVLIKVAVVVFVIAFGSFMVHPTNWHPFMPSGFGGVMSGAAIVFFAFIGFDAVSTTAEETKNPQRDLPIGMIASLIICTVLYVLMSGVLTGIKKYTGLSRRFRRGGDGLCAANHGRRHSSAPALSPALRRCSSSSSSVSHAFSWRWRAMVCSRSISPESIRDFARHTSRPSGPALFVGGVAMLTDIGSLADLTNIGTLFAFVLVCFGVIVLRRKDPIGPVRFGCRWCLGFRFSA